MTASRADIADCYRLILGRDGDDGGIDHWFAAVQRTGMSAHEAALGFLRSPEFRNKNPEFALKAPGLNLSECQQFPFMGLTLLLDPKEPIMQGVIGHGVHSPWILKVLEELLRPDAVFVDVGANSGVLGCYVAKHLIETGETIFVEPFADNCKLILANQALNGLRNCALLPFAVGSKVGTLFAAVEESSNKHVVADDSAKLKALDTVVVFPTVTLDLLLEDRERVDLIRMDVEGSEARALLGCKRVIARHRPLLLLEFCPEYYAGPDFTPRQYFELPISLGYEAEIVCRERGRLKIGTDYAAVTAYFAANPDWNWIDLLFTPT